MKTLGVLQLDLHWLLMCTIEVIIDLEASCKLTFKSSVSLHTLHWVPDTVGLISPVQHRYPCSETRQRKHRHQRA